MGAENRYNAQGQRMVAGCIPYRREKDSDTVEILMVRSQNGHNIVFPKGGWEVDESVQDAAIREAQEEAGVHGHVRDELGVWIFHKRSHQQWETNPDGACEVHMFLLEVTQELDTWPEQHRGRVWIDLNEVEKITLERCHHNWMREALGIFIQKQTSSSLIAEASPNEPRHTLSFNASVRCRL
ncbi:nudix hydrolase 17, mitochondrial [Selaginella moellendorffii]|uniref:nudix hydrolase 17, mitochondrial n=1 Tax=Selaginella moellendorffii TaxID=88036 RepID=UPI000D1C4F46|nr:nudix hydrolase 17, mitochondrial [Selaginella moellendorffii]|eukprot:XP_024530914.1 nudix hydrolase 17, mitochondrial [Selaginella moellendorffii]